MSYGPSMTKANMLGLVENTGWNDFLELNRMAFDLYLIHISEPTRQAETSYAVFCFQKKQDKQKTLMRSTASKKKENKLK